MSDIFSLDAEGNDALKAEAQANPIGEADLRPGFWHGTPRSIGMGLARVVPEIGRAAGLALSVPVGIAGALAYGDETRFTDPYFKALDEYTTAPIDRWTPAANEVGTAGKVLGGLTDVVGQLAIAGGNPIPMLATQGLGGAADFSRAGASSDVAALGGTVQAAGSALGFRIPFLGSTLTSRLASGAAGNLAIGGGTTLAEQQLFERTGNKQIAEEFNPLDFTGRATDFLTGLAYGAVHHLTTPPSLRDAALTASDAQHFQHDTAPGEPIDAAASVAHQQAMEQATLQLLRGEPVTAPDPVQNALFAPREESPAPQIPKDLQQLDATRAAEPPIGEPNNPIDIAATPEEKLAQLKALTASNVPAVQAIVEDLNKQLSGSTSKWNVKTDESTMAKAERPQILADKPWFSVEHIRDHLRFKTIVSDITQLEQVPKILAAHGVTVLKVDSAKMLTPKAWGWRSANLDLRMPNGQIVEHYTVLKEVDDAQQAEGHALYEEGRQIDTESASPQDLARLATLRERSKALYQAAWEAGLARAGTSGKALRASLENFDTSAGSSIESRSGSESQPAALADQAPANRTAPNPSNPRTVTIERSGVPATRSGFTGESPTEQIVPEAGTPEASSAHNQDTFAVNAARQAAASLDVPIPTGELRPDGTPVTMTARELLARGDAEIAQAQQEGKALEAVGDCFLATGV